MDAPCTHENVKQLCDTTLWSYWTRNKETGEYEYDNDDKIIEEDTIEWRCCACDEMVAIDYNEDEKLVLIEEDE